MTQHAEAVKSTMVHHGPTPFTWNKPKDLVHVHHSLAPRASFWCLFFWHILSTPVHRMRILSAPCPSELPWRGGNPPSPTHPSTASWQFRVDGATRPRRKHAGAVRLTRRARSTSLRSAREGRGANALMWSPGAKVGGKTFSKMTPDFFSR